MSTYTEATNFQKTVRFLAHPVHTRLNPSFKVQWCLTVTFKSVQCHPGLTYIFNF